MDEVDGMAGTEDRGRKDFKLNYIDLQKNNFY